MQLDSEIKVSTSPAFPDWVSQENISLCLTTYQAGKLVFIGRSFTHSLCISSIALPRCMGMYLTPYSLYVSSQNQILGFFSIRSDTFNEVTSDCLYVPQICYFTGGLDVHDLVADRDGYVVFANTMFSCLAANAVDASFAPIWKPEFISELFPEDRCHLNGIALREGVPRYVTMCGTDDTESAWRNNRLSGGVVMDVQTNEIVCEGLSMPHSPRWHQDKLWLLNSGQGEFGYVDLDQGVFVPVTFCPGYLRGLTFYKNFAVVGISQFQEDKTLSPLPFRDKLAKNKAQSHCGILFIDYQTGKIEKCLIFEAGITEIYDVGILPGVARPRAIEPNSEAAQTTIKIKAIIASKFC